MNIFITGTTKGIGFYLAQYFLNNGYSVYGCSRNIKTIEHPNYFHFTVDITSEEQVNNLILSFLESKTQIDVLINNAGIASMNFSVLTPFDSVKNIFNTNFFGTFLMIRSFFKILKKSKNPRIINFSTVAVPLNLEGESIYSSSKAAVEQLTKVMAKELSSFGITVNAIGPSPIMTDLIKNVAKEKLDRLIDRLPLKSFGNFEDVSNVIDFFIKPESKGITGQIIYLGGLSK
jgi:3-oxoacyl-[acyl-carrier protein] reductase